MRAAALVLILVSGGLAGCASTPFSPVTCGFWTWTATDSNVFYALSNQTAASGEKITSSGLPRPTSNGVISGIFNLARLERGSSIFFVFPENASENAALYLGASNGTPLLAPDDLGFIQNVTGENESAALALVAAVSGHPPTTPGSHGTEYFTNFNVTPATIAWLTAAEFLPKPGDVDTLHPPLDQIVHDHVAAYWRIPSIKFTAVNNGRQVDIDSDLSGYFVATLQTSRHTNEYFAGSHVEELSHGILARSELRGPLSRMNC